MPSPCTYTYKTAFQKAVQVIPIVNTSHGKKGNTPPSTYQDSVLKQKETKEYEGKDKGEAKPLGSASTHI